MFENFKQIDRPSKIRQYYPGTWQDSLKYFLINIPISFILLWIEYSIADMLPQPYVDSTHATGYDLLGNSIIWIFAALIFAIPEIVGISITIKTERPSNGFATILGFLVGGILFLFIIDEGWGLFMLFMAGCILLLHLIPHHHFSFRWGDILYFMGLGILICYITYLIVMHFMDIWAYLLIMITCTIFTMLLGNRIRQWGYAYLFGWELCSFYILFFGDILMGVYFILSSILLTVALLGIFFVAWRQIGNKAKLRQ